jgi:amino-acid N-acetyltransferase
MATITPDILPRPSLAAASKLLAAADLPTEDLTARHCEDFFFTGPADAPSGLVGLEFFGEVALLRSLVVSEAQRGTGAGSALLAHAELQARRKGIARIYLLTTTAEEFFARRGYSRVPRGAAPEAIRATREFAGICPASSAFMFKELKQ